MVLDGRSVLELGAVDLVTASLTDALTRAAAAEQWALVSKLVDELGARRLATSPEPNGAKVVDLGAERVRRGCA